MSRHLISTLGELKASGYQPKSIRNELRNNLIHALQAGENPFPGIIGYEESVIPDVERAILAGHNINFLGLRGQAKTRMARLMVNLLDEWVPVVKGSELNDDPMAPLGFYARMLIEEQGDKTPVEWLHRDDRYVEKLATPDVTVADLIGDVDPIKAASLKVGYNDERAIHFGLIPRSNRCIFVINELPDLQPRIQVALFNILQEGDIQIRGFKLRMPLDVQFVFTANPEDYTNRGSIVTPLKDRIGSQILTHYPNSLEDSMAITRQEAGINAAEFEGILADELMFRLMENIGFQARKSEFVDQKSGVSARLNISVYEAVMAGACRRMLLCGDRETSLRVSDLYDAVQAINGKIEMVYEGEQEGPLNVALNLIFQSIRDQFLQYYPGLSGKLSGSKPPRYRELELVEEWFNNGGELLLTNDTDNLQYKFQLDKVPGLKQAAHVLMGSTETKGEYLYMEFVLHGLAAVSRISRQMTGNKFQFTDLIGGMMGGVSDEEEEGYYSEE